MQNNLFLPNHKMDKNKQLDTLFKKWKLSKSYPHFIKDGIIDENMFESLDQKILFISKEANMKKYDDDNDFRVWWKDEHEKTFSIRVAQWAYGILHNFPEFESISYEKQRVALKSISFMDVKKLGGGNRSNKKDILKYVTQDLEFIKKQIDIIDPDIIVSSIDTKPNKVIFGEDFKKTGYHVNYLQEDGRLIIDFYHPSAQAGASMGYVLLEKVFKVIHSKKREA